MALDYDAIANDIVSLDELDSARAKQFNARIQDVLNSDLPEINVEIAANQHVVIEKMYGPMIFADLRITADSRRECWVIERLWIKTNEWVEWLTIPAQIDQEFDDPDADPGEETD